MDSNAIMFHGTQQYFRIFSNAYSQPFKYRFLPANALEEVYGPRLGVPVGNESRRVKESDTANG